MYLQRHRQIYLVRIEFETKLQLTSKLSKIQQMHGCRVDTNIKYLLV